MKKVLLIVTAVLLLGIGATGASGYFAAVSNAGTVNYTVTSDADLSLAVANNRMFNPNWAIADDVASYVNGGKSIELDFGDMQPWSSYQYGNVLRITNEQEYDVMVSARVDGNMVEARPNFCMAIAIAKQGWQDLNTVQNYNDCACCSSPWDRNVVYRGLGGGYDSTIVTCPSGCCDGDAEYGKVLLRAGESMWVSFCFMADGDKVLGIDQDGVITFTAER